MLSSFYLNILSPVLREKLYKGFEKVPATYIFNGLCIKEIKIMFLFSNTLSNKSIFFAFLLLLEKITLCTFSFIITKKSIANFNIKKQLKLGAIFTLTDIQKNQFLRLFMSYSLGKLDANTFFYSTNFIKYSFAKEYLSFGLQKILFNLLISLNNRDYELFAPLFENMVYGVHIYFYTSFRNFFINRLILSQYNLIIS